MRNAHRSAGRPSVAAWLVAFIFASAGTGCATDATPAPAEIPCPAPSELFWEQLGERCGGVTLPLCPEVERWIGQMLNYCEPLG